MCRVSSDQLASGRDFGASVSAIDLTLVGDYDEQRRRVRLRARRTKARKPHWVELHPLLVEALEARFGPREDRNLEARLFADSGADDSGHRSARHARLPAWSPHDLRHRRISLLHLRGVPWARIGEFVGQRRHLGHGRRAQPCARRRDTLRPRFYVAASIENLDAMLDLLSRQLDTELRIGHINESTSRIDAASLRPATLARIRRMNEQDSILYERVRAARTVGWGSGLDGVGCARSSDGSRASRGA